MDYHILHTFLLVTTVMDICYYLLLLYKTLVKKGVLPY